jgi:putative DNA primase/helicase
MARNGKTLFTLGVAYAVATGGSFLGWKAGKPRPVMYIDGELPAETLQQRLAHTVRANPEDLESGFLQFITPDRQTVPIANLAGAKAQELLTEYLLKHKTELLIIDSLATLCHSGPENEGESWLPIQSWALRLRREGLAVFFVHHAGKGGAQRGTSRREDVLDTVLHLVRPSDYDPQDGALFEVHFDKARGLHGEDVRPIEARMDVKDDKAVWTIRDVEDANLLRAVELFKAGESLRTVAEELHISKTAAHRLSRKAKERGLLK